MARPPPESQPAPLSPLRGASRLAIAATRGLTDLVEAMHAEVLRLPGMASTQRTGGITGLVYRSVHGVTRLVGGGLDLALAQLAPLLAASAPTERDPAAAAVLAALNGVLGDYLAASTNPLAIAMQLRANGQLLDPAALAQGTAMPGPRPLVMLHGLCMNDLQWRRNGADFPAALAALGYTPLLLHYNSGLAIWRNGQALAELLESLLPHWPVPVQELTLLGHSMGGLVARSAIEQARQQGMQWPGRLRRLLTLGTPHLGAPLERGGQQLQHLLELSAYSRPLAALAARRSAGIRDLRHGSLLAGDGGRLSRLALPAGVACYAIAATTGKTATGLPARLVGDGLVPVSSALGQHREVQRRLAFPADHQAIFTGMGHLALQTDAAVLARLQQWLAAPP